MVKVDIPEFKGQMDLDIFIEWMQIVEQIIEYKYVSNNSKVKLFAIKIKKRASL